MKKGWITAILMCITLFITASCTKLEKEVIVFSFSGENDKIAIDNGLIIVTGDEEKFIGGDLSFKEDAPANVQEYFGKFLFDKESDEQSILSHAVTVEGNTEGTEISSELGTIASEELFYKDDLELIRDSLKFSLSGKSMNGEQFDYQLDLDVKKAY